MARFDLRVTGLDKLIAQMEEAPKETRAAVATAVYQFAEEVMADSKQVVPVRTGTLMATGHVDPPEDSGDAITVTMGYGGPAAPYALYVHEALEGARPPSPNWSWTKAVQRGHQIHWTRPGSGPKYLENPLKAKQGELPGRVGDAVREALLAHQ